MLQLGYLMKVLQRCVRVQITTTSIKGLTSLNLLVETKHIFAGAINGYLAPCHTDYVMLAVARWLCLSCYFDFNFQKKSTLVYTLCSFAHNRRCLIPCGLLWFTQPAPFSIVLTVQSVELVKTGVEGVGVRVGPIPLKAVCNSSWPNPTPPQPEDQWWCSNLTDWAQRFVCLKPLTYFYSHCRSQSLYGMIAELMLLVYSNSSLEKKKFD